jgi:hypothetical protein
MSVVVFSQSKLRHRIVNPQSENRNNPQIRICKLLHYRHICMNPQSQIWIEQVPIARTHSSEKEIHRGKNLFVSEHSTNGSIKYKTNFVI